MKTELPSTSAASTGASMGGCVGAHRGQETAGVYVHFPWCLAKCPYCDFVSFAAPRAEIDHQGYADAVLRELAARAPLVDGRKIETIFFGGGTPSLWDPRQLGRTLAAIQTTLDCADDVEVTVECNPTSLDAERARALAAEGVNRFSIGVQALDAKRLQFLGRKHDPAGALAAIRDALLVANERSLCGSPPVRISADLIFAVAGETPEEAEREAIALADLGLSHLSCYELTIEQGTQFGELARRGRLPLADDARTAEAFFAIDRALTSRGFHHYEISNYARPGNEARHNLGYWRGDPYLGLGCGAYGTVAGPLGTDGSGLRYRNVIDPKKYMESTRFMKGGIAGDDDGVSISSEPLDGETLMRERIMLGLRLEQGVDIAASARALGVEAWPRERERESEKMIERGRICRDGDRIWIPKEAWIFANDTAARLF